MNIASFLLAFFPGVFGLFAVKMLLTAPDAEKCLKDRKDEQNRTILQVEV